MLVTSRRLEKMIIMTEYEHFSTVIDDALNTECYCETCHNKVTYVVSSTSSEYVKVGVCANHILWALRNIDGLALVRRIDNG